MKKIVFSMIIISLMSAAPVYCEHEKDAINERATGNDIFTFLGRREDGPAKVASYITGILDALYAVQPLTMGRLYSGSSYRDIIKTVRLYYENNKARRGRSVTDLILSGCQ